MVKTNVGVKRQKNSHDASFTNSTTLDFAYCQPTMCQLMLSKSTVNVNAKQFLRLAPMPLPTLGDVRVYNKAVFVPIADVNPNFDVSLSDIPVRRYDGMIAVGDKDVNWTLSGLTRFLLGRCEYSFYTKSDVSGNMDLVVSAATNYVSDINTKYKMHLDSAKQRYTLSDAVSVNGADYVIYGVPGTNNDLIVTFRFSNEVKAFRKVLIGLGYQLNFDSYLPVSITRLLAWYKAYFDTFNPARLSSFQYTFAYQFIQNITIKPQQFQDGSFFDKAIANDSGYFVSFLDSLLACFTTDSQNFVSLHMADTATVTPGVPSYDSSPSDGAELAPIIDPVLRQPVITVGADHIEKQSINKVQMDILRHLTHYVNKDSAIGQRIKKWLEAHYDSDVVFSLYNDTRNVSEFEFQAQISDVMSFADTASPDGQGEYLGSYAGKGTGDGQGQFSFTAPCNGYLFVITYLKPITRYYQGVDPTIFAIDRFRFPQTEFDAVGWELTPKVAIYGDNDVCIPAGIGSTGTKEFDQSFGYIPRYSGFKTSKNIVNGDMSRRGVFDSYSPFYLDRQIIRRGLSAIPDSSVPGRFKFKLYDNAIPTASENWRYTARYPYLSNYNRIFYNSGNVYDGTEIVDDNFILYTKFDVKYINTLKPLMVSFDTICENDDNNVSVEHS